MNVNLLKKTTAGLFVISVLCVPTYPDQPVLRFINPLSVRREVDLMRSLLVATNAAFDRIVATAIPINTNRNVTITYLQVSFIFYYPDAKEVSPSNTELGFLDDLAHKSGRIVREPNSTNQIPLNYIRVFDSSKSDITAELDIFVSVSPLNGIQPRQYYRRSFYFVYKDGWKEGKKI